MSEPVFWFVAALAGSILLFASPAQSARPEPARHQLAVSFDFEEQLLHAISLIDLPPGAGAQMYLGDFHVAGLSIDGQPVPEAISEGQVLNIFPQEGSRRIRVEYHQHYDQASGSLLSREGIALLGHWHPLLDRDALFELTAIIPREFEAVSEADQIISREIPEGREVRFRFPQPVGTINFVAGPYVVESVPFGEGRELFTYFFPEDQELAAGYREKTLGYLARYEREIGPFPYRRFSVVENRLPTGFAMPSFTLLGQAVVRLPFIVDTSLGHEVLHQWFGNAVRVETRQGNWAEGLTTYLADHAYEADEGRGAEFRKNQLIRYESYIHEENRMPLASFTGIAGGEVRQEDLRAIGYHKAGMVFHMLRNLIGEQHLWQGLRDFYGRMKFRSASWQDLRESFEKASGEDLTRFFEQWLTRSDQPALAAAKLRTETREGGPVLAFELRQIGEQPYELLVPVEIRTVRGTIRRQIAISEAVKEVRVALDSLPEELTLDPEYDLMRSLAPAELPPVWSRFQGAPAKIAVLEEADGEVYKPLLEVLPPGLEVKSPAEVTDLDLAAGSIIFLGTASRPARSLFGTPAHPRSGFTVDVRTNPLNPAEVAVLVSSSSVGETAQAAGRLRHYGKYSYLHFAEDRVQTRKIADSEQGRRYPVLEPPRGVALPQTLSFEQIVDRLLENRVIHVGENHASYEDHLLQLRVIQALHHRDPDLAIGMEMFPRPVQEVLDAYITGEYGEWEFLKKSNYFENWGFDYRLYREILDFARNNAIPVVALNLQKGITSKVFQEGTVSALNEEEAALVPPERDLDLPGYRERLASVFAMHGHSGQEPMDDKIKGFIQAQSMWDETMAATAAEYLEANPGRRLVILAGRGHVFKDNAIPPRLARRLEVTQVVVVNGDDQSLEPGRYDYVLFSPKVSLPPAPVLGVVLGDEGGSLVIRDLAPQGPAESAGLKQGDEILAIDDEPVRSMTDLRIIMLYKEKGQTVRLRVLRPGKFLKARQLTVEVGL